MKKKSFDSPASVSGQEDPGENSPGNVVIHPNPQTAPLILPTKYQKNGFCGVPKKFNSQQTKEDVF